MLKLPSGGEGAQLMGGVQDLASIPNRRGHPRRRALKNALIVFNGGQCTMPCHVLEISDTGARLVPTDPLLCPGEFVLKPRIGAARDCEVVWRKGTHVGIRYMSEPTTALNGLAEKTEPPTYAADPVHERGVLEDVVELLLLENKGREKSCAFIAVSILNAPQIANLLGSNTVEAVVLDTAWRLRACLRASDVIGRLSDDILGVVLPSFRDDGAEVVAEKIRSLSARPATTIHGQVEIELGVQSVLFPTESRTAAEVINRSLGETETALARYTSLRNRPA